MLQYSFSKTFKRLTLNRKYIVFSIFFGLSTLIIPLAVQFLVNNLALAGIWINTLSFLIIIGVGLILTQTLRYSQIIITEYLQREIYVDEMTKWQSKGLGNKSYFYFEIIKVMKTYSTAFTNIVEIGLIISFGLITIILFHPGFIVMPILIVLVIFWIHRDSRLAIETSIEESNQKYEIYYAISDNSGVNDQQIDNYLAAREKHFHYIKKNTLLMGVIYILCQIFLLGTGIYFIQTNQLSVGQLVSAEIILSGILTSLSKLPKTMEDLYDFETSKYKLLMALKE